MTGAIENQLMGAGQPPPTDVGEGSDSVLSNVARSLQGMPPEEQGDQLSGLAKTLKAFGQMQNHLKDSPLAQRMFQETQRQKMAQQQQLGAQDMVARKQDMATQILANSGLL